MSQNCNIFDQCNCPSRSDTYGRMHNFHDAADEIEDVIIEVVGDNNADNR